MKSALQARVAARFQQRGVAALVVSLLLLFGMSVTTFFFSRGMIFEQKTSANQYRATRAFEVAEAGLEWAVAALNENRGVDAFCIPQNIALKTFRKKFAPKVEMLFDPNVNTSAACRIVGSSATAPGTLACSCPDDGTQPTLAAGDEPRFTVYFTRDDADRALSLRVTAYGCVGPAAGPKFLCDSSAGPGTFESKAMVAVTLKQRASLPRLPGAALTVGGDAKVKDLSAENLDPTTNGLLVDAGGEVNAKKDGMKRAITLPGRPPQDAMIENDPVLKALAAADTSGDAMFNHFFGMTVDDFAAMGRTATITGGIDELRLKYAQGFTSFYVTSELKFEKTDIGTPDRPVIIVLDRAKKPKFDGDKEAVVYGLVYQNDDEWKVDHHGTIRGATISRGKIESDKDVLFAYDRSVLHNLQDLTSEMVRVPGSWRDFVAP